MLDILACDSIGFNDVEELQELYKLSRYCTRLEEFTVKPAKPAPDYYIPDTGCLLAELIRYPFNVRQVGAYAGKPKHYAYISSPIARCLDCPFDNDCQATRDNLNGFISDDKISHYKQLLALSRP